MKKEEKKKKGRTMEEVTAGYEEFMKGKQLNPNGFELFDKTIKKAATPKKRGSK
jgi:hypothetical protein